MIVFLLIILYFIPTLNAYSNKKKNAGSVLVINFFLGWTLIGWVVALSMSMGKEKPVVVAKEPEPHKSAPSAPSASSELVELFKLKEKGAITEEEFKAHKAKLLR